MKTKIYSSKPYRTSKNHRKNECGFKVISEKSTSLITSEVLNTDEAGDGFLWVIITLLIFDTGAYYLTDF